MKTNFKFLFFDPSGSANAESFSHCINSFLPFLYLDIYRYVKTGNSLLLKKEWFVPECTNNFFYFLNAIKSSPVNISDPDLIKLHFLFSTNELNFLQHYFSNIWPELSKEQKLLACFNDIWTLQFLELLAQYASEFKIIPVNNDPLFIQMPGNFARDVITRVKLPLEVVKELQDVVKLDT